MSAVTRIQVMDGTGMVPGGTLLVPLDEHHMAALFPGRNGTWEVLDLHELPFWPEEIVAFVDVLLTPSDPPKPRRH